MLTCPFVSVSFAEVAAEAEAEQLSLTRLRKTPCLWAGCGIVLNSTAVSQRHAALHADENAEWVSLLFLSAIIPVASAFLANAAD